MEEKGFGKIKDQIFSKYWVEGEGEKYFVIGLNRDEAGNLIPLDIRTSNMGHLLNSKLLDGDEYISYRERIINTLFSEEMLAISGIRSLSNKETRFRPGAYHNGNVWLWDTYFISQGLERHGYTKLADKLNKRILNVVNTFKKFPEFANGGSGDIVRLNQRVVDIWDDNLNRMNRIEQLPQEIQAWTVAAALAIKYRNGDKIFGRYKIPEKALDPRIKALEDEILSKDL